MSNLQKIFASLSAAVIVHVLLLAIVFAMLGTRESTASHMNQGQQAREKEVTIMLSDLMEQVKVEPPEPDLPSLPPRVERSFFDTSTNQREAKAPENARFYSDRNTTAATEILPDPNLPQVDGPTTDGDAPIPHLSLQDLDLVEGELTPSASKSEGERKQVAARQGVETGQGSDAEVLAGVDTTPENQVAEKRARPPRSAVEGEDAVASRRKSYTDPNSEYATDLALPEHKADQFPSTESAEAAEEGGEIADEKESRELMSGLAEGAGKLDGDSHKDTPEFGKRPGDVGLFSDEFQAFARKNSTNGTLSNLGDNAVDAEDTPAGKYEADVRKAVAKKWHELRAENGDFVTYSFLKLRCRVDRYGKVHDLEVVENQANTVVTSFSLDAILQADLPRMPADVADEYGPSGLKLNYDIYIY